MCVVKLQVPSQPVAFDGMHLRRPEDCLAPQQEWKAAQGSLSLKYHDWKAKKCHMLRFAGANLKAVMLYFKS